MKMKTIEEKAKAYDEALERAKELLEIGLKDTRDKRVVLSFFPELAESDDKKMIQYFKDLAPFDNAEELYEKYGFSHKDAIAWLEKQCEQKPVVIIPKFRVGDEIKTSNEESLTITKIDKKGYWSEDLFICDFDEECIWDLVGQKPTDKVESKFKIGDWLIYNTPSRNPDICIVTEITDDLCKNRKIGEDRIRDNSIEFVNRNYRLWTIQDAKDGDVLVASDGSFFIFKGMIDCACKHYVALTTDDVVKFNEGLEHYWETSTAVHPATKEQRDTLMKAIADAGYTFDFEKKELKKIGQKSAWSEEDDKKAERIIRLLQEAYDINYINGSINWLKSLRPQSHWKPSLAQLNALSIVSKGNAPDDIEAIVSLYNDLKKLREE